MDPYLSKVITNQAGIRPALRLRIQSHYSLHHPHIQAYNT